MDEQQRDATDFSETRSQAASFVHSPRLLVSVRDAAEVSAAIAGGCDIIDVKDPSRGSLGMADAATWQAVADEMQRLESRLERSIALGEISDSLRIDSAVPIVDEPVRIPNGWTYAKLGIAGLGCRSDWPVIVGESRIRWSSYSPMNCGWILVVYADCIPAGSPSISALHDELPAMLECGQWAGVLIDTFSKDGRTLLDCVDVTQLNSLAEIVRQACQLWCVAGSLRADCLPDVLQSQPDVIGIRTAGCRNQRREQSIDEHAVRAFKDAMKNPIRAGIAASQMAQR
ncbi:MAG: (5-formylfuran-3-yl)methyl phosphate synthase [Planctomycetaceae bacterium]